MANHATLDRSGHIDRLAVLADTALQALAVADFNQLHVAHQRTKRRDRMDERVRQLSSEQASTPRIGKAHLARL
ncbi:MAG: hypothetical protein ACJAYX_004755 [Planctomycetota bacterium]